MKRRVESSHGVSYLEMLLATLILALCSGFICDAMAFGFAHLREREKGDSAVILLDALCSAVRNDLEYATEYHSDNSFARTVRVAQSVRNDLEYATEYDSGSYAFTRTLEDRENQQPLSVLTWYGTGQWRADDPQSYEDAATIQWRGIPWRDSRNAKASENRDRGQIIRKIKLINGDYFDCVAPPECYSGYGEVKNGLYAGLDIEYVVSEDAANEIERFTVTIWIYDAPDTGANLLAQRKFAVIPVQPIAFKD